MHPFLSPSRQESVNTQQSHSSSGSSNSQEIQGDYHYWNYIYLLFMDDIYIYIGQSFQSTEGISRSLQSHGTGQFFIELWCLK